VVDTEVTGKQLLDKGQLGRRVTFIPLNKISAQLLSKESVQRAKSLVIELTIYAFLLYSFSFLLLYVM